MLQEDIRLDPPGSRFVIRPNHSLTWQEARVVLAGIAAVGLIIGTVFCSVGLPFVLPFSGLEVIGVAAAFYYCQRRALAREVVSIDEQQVTVESGRTRPTVAHAFQRAWVRVVLERSRDDWYPSRLKLCSHGRELEIGGFLNEEERLELARRLSLAVGRTTGAAGLLKT